MATTTTYGLNKPTVGGDENTWGGLTNDNWDDVDDLLDGTTPIKPDLDEGLWKVGGVAVTATAAQLNKLDGVTWTLLDYNTLTASAAELNQLDGNVFTADLTIPDKIVHAGDTNTSIRFPATDTVTVETSGAEQFRITSAGNVGVGTSSPSEKLDVNGTVKASGLNLGGTAVTATAAELNYLDITTLGTSQASKVVTADANGDVKFANAIVETVHTLTGTSVALNPNNGTIQTHALSGNTTYTDSLAAGESMTLTVTYSSQYTITWPTITWINNGGSARTLKSSGFTVFVLWKAGSTLYGAFAGDAT